MKRRERIVSLALFTIILLNFTIVLNTQAEQILIADSENYQIIVDINGEGDYDSIQDAINNAQAGSKIYIKKGEYPEIINIRKQIELIGEDRDLTLISPISETNKFAIFLGAENSIIRDLSIKNRGPGLYASAVRITASNTEIYNCNILDTPVGIAIWTSNNIIDNCYFSGCKDEGIALLGTSYSDCSNNKITNCIFEKNCDGIELQYSSRNTIENCEFYNNTHSGIDAIASSNDKNIISNCEIYNNDAYGIYLASSSNNQIIDCIISDNKDGNIVMKKNSHNNEIINTESNKIENKENKEDDSTRQLNPFMIIFLQRFSRLKSILNSTFNLNLRF
jgi:parallel beta-helix repeat protein